MKKTVLTIGLAVISAIGWGQAYNILVHRTESEKIFDAYGNFSGFEEILFTDTLSINHREVEYILDKISREHVLHGRFNIDGFIKINGEFIDTVWQCEWDRKHRPLHKINLCRVNHKYQIKVSYLEQLIN